MIQAITERDVLKRFKDARLKKEAAKSALEEANREFEMAEAALIESLNARNAEATAKYEGIGYASLVKPRVYARYDKESETTVFEYLKTVGREDLIKQTVNPQSLSGFVGEMLGAGTEIPETIKYYLKPSVRFYE